MNPLLASMPAGAQPQQVMSPTLGQGYGTTTQQSSPPPGRDGLQQVPGLTPPPAQGQSGGMGFEPNMATGGALGGIDQHEPSGGSGGMPPVSTTITRGDVAHHVVQMPGVSSGESPDLQTSTGVLGTVSGDALSGGVVAGDSQVEGFVTPRSQQGLPTIAEVVEGFPSAGLQLMTQVGEFFRVARTEVMQVPTVAQGTHATPPRTITLQSRDSPSGARRQLALGEGSLGSQSSSPPQLGAHGTPTSFAPPPGRDGSLLSADMLQRMHALEQRAPLLYGSLPERPPSRTDSSSLPQEAIQAEVARQLAGFDQRAQAQDLELQRMRRQLEEAAQREQALREQVRREVVGTVVPQWLQRHPLLMSPGHPFRMHRCTLRSRIRSMMPQPRRLRL